MKNLLRAFVLIMLAAAVSAGATAHAQSQKRVVKIDESTGELVDVTQAQPAPVQAAPGIVILNNQKSSQSSNQGSRQAQTVIQDQPTNVIEDSPLNMSSAERRRRDRQGLELQTEQKIVEKLEDARIEDERARSERLFNKGFSSHDHKEEQAQQPVQVVPAPQPVQIIVERHEEKREAREEVRTAIEDVKPKHEDFGNQFYIQGLAGVGEYPDASNVKGNMALGFGLGMVTPERIVAEGTFQYSQYDVNQAGSANFQPTFNQSASIPFSKVTQYNFQAALKYQILGGRVRPVIGVIAGYTYRSYDAQNGSYTYGSTYNSSSQSPSSNALDLGALIGLDVQLTTTFSIGGDFRYMKNVAYRGNGDYSNAYRLPAPYKRLEEINYYLGSIVGKFTF